MMTGFWTCMLAGLSAILTVMLIMVLYKKSLPDKLNFVFVMDNRRILTG